MHHLILNFARMQENRSYKWLPNQWYSKWVSQIFQRRIRKPQPLKMNIATNPEKIISQYSRTDASFDPKPCKNKREQVLKRVTLPITCEMATVNLAAIVTIYEGESELQERITFNDEIGGGKSEGEGDLDGG